MLSIYADQFADTNSRLLVERFHGEPAEADVYSLTLTSVGGLGLIQLTGLTRHQVEALARGIGEVLAAQPETATAQ